MTLIVRDRIFTFKKVAFHIHVLVNTLTERCIILDYVSGYLSLVFRFHRCGMLQTLN